MKDMNSIRIFSSNILNYWCFWCFYLCYMHVYVQFEYMLPSWRFLDLFASNLIISMYQMQKITLSHFRVRCLKPCSKIWFHCFAKHLYYFYITLNIKWIYIFFMWTSLQQRVIYSILLSMLFWDIFCDWFASKLRYFPSSFREYLTLLIFQNDMNNWQQCLPSGGLGSVNNVVIGMIVDTYG